MIVSHSRRFLFLKTRHTASTSIQINLEEYCDENDIATRYRRQNEPEPTYMAINGVPHILLDDALGRFVRKRQVKSYFKFCFVRNPFTRLPSAFWENRRFSNNFAYRVCPNLDISDIEAVRKAFSTWIIHAPRPSQNCHEFTLFHGKPVMDFIGKFENLLEDYAHVCGLLDIPVDPLLHRHKHEKPKCHYSEMYTRKARARVEDIAKLDLEFFGYRFEEQK